jgi:endonuclease/exonuclease/phosphatase (EEP) superfamily protein YafD
VDSRVVARRSAEIATQLGVVAIAGASALALIPVWPCSLFEHFRVQYVLAGILLVAAASVFARRGWLDAIVIAVVIDACVIVPDLGSDVRAVPAGSPLRVLLLNVHTQSTTHEQVRRLIADEGADVVALLEVDRRWLAELAPALVGYPHRIEHPRSDNFGLALYARQPVRGEVEALGSEFPTLVAELALARPLAFVLTHPIPPVGRAAGASNAAQLAAVGRRAHGLGTPVVLLGDFNATPWSVPFLKLRNATGFCDSRAGFGLHTTFPAASTLLRVPIDHVMVSCSIGVRDRRIGRDVGSDHLPVIVDLVVP